MDNAKQIIARALKADNLREFTVRNWLRGIPRYSSPENVNRLQLMADDLRLAGVPDHMDETLDSGVPSTGEMRDRARINTPTPMKVPGGQTVTTQDVIALLAKEKPLILSTTPFTPTIPGTSHVTLVTGGTLDDNWQPRLGRLMRQLTTGTSTDPWRQLYQERPARHEYHFAEAGEQLFAVLHAIRDWGDRFLRDDPENIVAFRHSCGTELHVEIRCAACGEVVAPGDVTGDREVRRSDIVCTERCRGA